MRLKGYAFKILSHVLTFHKRICTAVFLLNYKIFNVYIQGCRNGFLHGGAKIKALFEMKRTQHATVKITTALRFAQENFHFYPIYFSITISFLNEMLQFWMKCYNFG